MLLWLRPFRIGDFIEVGAIAGTVREMGLFACHLETFDGMSLFAPNSAIWNNPLKNHTRNAGRLVSIDVTVARTPTSIGCATSWSRWPSAIPAS
jgi:small conductance mechanosensitive channel